MRNITPNALALQALLAVVAAHAAACATAPSFGSFGDGEGSGNGAAAGTVRSADGGGAYDRGGGGSGDGTGGGGLPCDVSAVLEKNCATCHGATPSFGAPNALVTYADLTKSGPSGKMFDLVQKRMHATQGVMPPSPASPLGASDLGVFDAWVAAGASASTAACGPSGADAGPAVKPLSCTPDTFVRAGTPFTMPAGKADIYMCYGFEATTTAKRHVVGFAPKVDNAKMVHHLLLFQADAAYGTTPQECSSTTSASWRLVTGWAPGGPNMETPPEAGFPEDPGTTHWILQVHYNNTSGQAAGQVDRSGYDLCTTDKLRPNDAAVMAPGTLNMTLPPRATTDITCDWSPLLIGKVHLFGATPHMHKLGTKMSTYVTHNGVKTKIVDQQSFDFNYQSAFPASADLEDGDTVSTRCAWNNTTDTAVKWGENTTDEMCFNFIPYYPKIDSPLWSWTTPSILGSCHPTAP